MAITQRKLPARLIWIGATVLLLMLIVHFAGIALLRYFVEETLHPALPKGTYLGEVHLNLLTGSLDVRDFELRRDGELRIRLGELNVAVSPWRLLAGKVHVRRAALSNGYFRVDRLPDGSFDLGLPPFGDGAADAEPGPPPPVSLAGALLERVAVDYWDGELGTVLYANRLELGAYDAGAEQQQVPVEWDLEWDGRPLRGSAEVALAGDGIGVEGRLETGLLDVGLARQLARADHAVLGELGADLRFAWNGSRLTLDGDLRAPALEYQADPMAVRVEGLALPGLDLELDVQPALAVRLALGAESAVERLDWRDGAQGAELDGLRLGGRFEHNAAQGAAAEQLVIDLVQAAWRDGERKAAVDRLQLRGSGSLPAGAQLPLVRLDLAAGRVAFDDGAAGLSLVLDEPRLGEVSLAAEGEAAHRLEAAVALGPVRVEQADTGLVLGSAAASIAGRVGDSMQLGGDLDLDGVELSHPALPVPPLRVAGLSAKGLGWDGAGRFDRLDLRDINLPAHLEETSLRIAGLVLSEARYAADSGVSLGSVVVDGLQTGVIRDASGTWRHVMSGPGDPAAESVAAAVPEPAAPAQGEVKGDADTGLAWSLGEFRVTGDSHISGADYLNPDMQPGRFFVKRFEVGALSTARADSNTPFDIVLQPDRYSDITLKGLARPLAEKRFIEVEGHIEAFGMRSLNGLVGRDLGHRFLEGQLDNDFKLTIDARQLEMNNNLVLHRLTVEELEGKEGPPLSTAIALLEDSDGNIKLDVPISGNLDDPQFRVLGALNPIIMKAVAGTAALAIQPLGSVLLVGGLLANQALKVSFEPALFAPGSSELDGAARKQLSDLAGKLVEKPKLALRVCGVVAVSERRKDKEGKFVDQESDVLELAQRRAEAARAHMLAQGVGDKQLRSCRPSIDAAPEAKPRVDIRL
jgi:hypothetical protein